MTAIKELLLEFIGSYELIPDAVGLSAIDFPWIISGLLLILCVWGTFGLLRKFMEVLF